MRTAITELRSERWTTRVCAVRPMLIGKALFPDALKPPALHLHEVANRNVDERPKLVHSEIVVEETFHHVLAPLREDVVPGFGNVRLRQLMLAKNLAEIVARLENGQAKGAAAPGEDDPRSGDRPLLNEILLDCDLEGVEEYVYSKYSCHFALSEDDVQESASGIAFEAGA